MGVRVSDEVSGTLSVVALPIGNLADITYRAVEVLRAADVIAAEDTRHLLKLRRAYDITTPALSYHDFNEQSRAQHLVELMREGKNVALVSDAGTPMVSDPGYRVVTAAIEAGLRVTSVPGASAAVAALVASGLPTSQFRFVGFPPRTRSRRRAFFVELARDPATLVVYEAPHRLLATLADLREGLGDRSACVARNITKPSESYQRGPVSSIVSALEREPVVRGEATIVVAGYTEQPVLDAPASATETIGKLIVEGLDTRAIARRVMAEHGLSRRDAYALVVGERTRQETDGV
jgi:16S rRNA (cytidine1402-2'-O)-methyltransferase